MLPVESALHHESLVGETIGGKYRIVTRLGAGGMGVVYEAEHLKLRQSVALKMLHPDQSDAELIARFEREARATVRLKSPHVAAVMDIDRLESGAPYMVMELLHGRDLRKELDRRGPLPPGEAVSYLLQACSAIAEAHQHGIVHRDLKPSNLFLARDASGVTLKVLDFGISKMLVGDDSMRTGTKSVLGTPTYMSPEQIRSTKSVDHRTDIWSLGVVLYELVTGRVPFEGETPTAVIAAIAADSARDVRELMPELAPALGSAIMRAIEKHASQRFATVEEFADALRPFDASALQVPTRPGLGEATRGATISEATTVRASSAPPAKVRSSKEPDPTAARSVEAERTGPGWTGRTLRSSVPAAKGRALLVVGLMTLAGAVAALLVSRAGGDRVTTAERLPTSPRVSAAQVQPTPAQPESPPANTAVVSAAPSAPVVSVAAPASASERARNPPGAAKRPKPATAKTTATAPAPVPTTTTAKAPAPQKNPLFL